jgi:hypothetical protein
MQSPRWTTHCSRSAARPLLRTAEQHSERRELRADNPAVFQNFAPPPRATVTPHQSPVSFVLGDRLLFDAFQRVKSLVSRMTSSRVRLDWGPFRRRRPRSAEMHSELSFRRQWNRCDEAAVQRLRTRRPPSHRSHVPTWSKHDALFDIFDGDSLSAARRATDGRAW